ncbi:MAG: UDP-N-acetylmuramoyl-L-alanyl-D-glutamate--2,6-diaminopimelate ligase [bacterium]|nr:UDP-N-acetylmuramoyl-L-alanyl-D-glutamate--2,6-diaminopimelate ligase [bacterium]
MKNKRLSELLNNIKIIKCTGSCNPVINSLIYDSREVKKGSLFFALKGIHTDGHKYINKAIEMGAVAIVHSDNLESYNPAIDYIQVPDSRQSMSPISSAYYGLPSSKLKIIGVTGTDGKSSTVSMIHQLLEALGKKSGFISTVNYKTADKVAKHQIRQSTPESTTIHRLLAEMVDNGKEYAVVESTSHGLSDKTSRLKDVRFNGAVLTNVTHEHLEFHGSIENYRDDKANLFRMASDFAIINHDDDNYELFEEASGSVTKVSYSTNQKNCDYYSENALPDPKGTNFDILNKEDSHSIRLNIPGLVNIENILAATAAVKEITDESLMDILKQIPKLKSVKGRMALIKGSQPFDVYVDYAHTPGSYKKVFPLFKKAAKKRLITVFGSAGERDIEKRAVQGEIADQFSDIILLTDEDPRLEDSMGIINDIKEGIKNRELNKDLFLISDRKEAIKKALELAEPGDMVITLGKGHESSIEYSDGHHPWDEISIVEELLKDMKFR